MNSFVNRFVAMFPKLRIFGPIFSAEMITTARRKRYYFMRLAYASFLFVMLWSAYESNFSGVDKVVDISRIAAFAGQFFVTFSFVQIIAILLLAPALTAGTIAEERERRTIEYLFATDLSNSEIILGKLTARLLVILCQVLAGLPILSLAMLMGGIEPEKLLIVFLVSFSTAFVLAALGISVSVWSPRARDAVTRTYLFLFALLFLPWLTYVVPAATGLWLAPVAAPLIAANPITFLTMMFAGGAGWSTVWILVMYQAGFAVFCLVLSVAAVRRVHLKSSGKADEPKRYQHRRRRPIGNLPMLWKELFVERAAARLGIVGRIAMLLILAAVVGLCAWQWWYAVTGPLGFFWGSPLHMYSAFAIPMHGFVASLTLLIVAARASGSITTEKEKDTWNSLLCTTLTPREIVAAKVLGNLFALRWMLLMPILIYVPMLFMSADFIIAFPFVIGTFLVLCLFVTILGVTFSLKSRSTMRSMAGTLCTAIFVGGGYLLCCCLPVAFAGSSGVFEAIMFGPCIPFLLAMPGALYLGWQDDLSLSSRESQFLLAYVIGIGIYAVTAMILYAVNVSNFDKLAGRSSVQ